MKLAPMIRPWPDVIQFELLDSDEFFDDFAVRHLWHPFEAACLIRGYCPRSLGHGKAVVGIVTAHALDQKTIDEFSAHDAEASADLIRLTESIVQQWGTSPAVASEIVEWALGKGLLWDTRFVRKVLGRTPDHAHLQETERLHAENERLREKLAAIDDKRGEHFKEKRLAILGFALQELATLTPNATRKIDNLLHGGAVSASKLTTYLDTYRTDLSMPEATVKGFGYGAIEDALRDAFAAAKKHSTDKN